MKDKDRHTLCNNCRGKSCSADDRCSHCHDWTDERWEKVIACHWKASYSAGGEGEGEVFFFPFFQVSLHPVLYLFLYQNYGLAQLII